MSTLEARHDAHRPSAMDPSEYVFVGAADDHGHDSYIEIRHDVLRTHGIETGGAGGSWSDTTAVPFYNATEDGRPNYRCHHCGKHGSNIRYFVFFLHIPTKVVICVGQICAKKLNLASKDQLDLQTRAKAYRRAHAREIWGLNNPAEYAVIESGMESNEFLASLYAALGRFGSLTANQMTAVQKFSHRQSDSKPLSAPASDKQVRYIKSLIEGREIDPVKLSDTLAQLEAGITKKQASAWIEKLITLPKKAI